MSGNKAAADDAARGSGRLMLILSSSENLLRFGKNFVFVFVSLSFKKGILITTTFFVKPTRLGMEL